MTSLCCSCSESSLVSLGSIQFRLSPVVFGYLLLAETKKARGIVVEDVTLLLRAQEQRIFVVPNLGSPPVAADLGSPHRRRAPRSIVADLPHISPQPCTLTANPGSDTPQSRRPH